MNRDCTYRQIIYTKKCVIVEYSKTTKRLAISFTHLFIYQQINAHNGLSL